MPYSLHDMRVSDITLSDGQLTLQFETGLIRIAEPCVQVDGRVVLTGVESCEVWRLSPNGEYGSFSGKKQTWEKFPGSTRSSPLRSQTSSMDQPGAVRGIPLLPDREKLTEFCMQSTTPAISSMKRRNEGVHHSQ